MEDYYDKTTKELHEVINKEVTEELSVDQEGLRYYIQDIIGVADNNISDKEALLKALSKNSTVTLGTIKKMYVEERRLMKNDQARKNPVPVKYLEISNRILTMLLSPSIEIRAEAQELLVKEFLKENYVVTTRNDKVNEMWIYQDGIYVPNGISYVKEFCRMMLGQGYSSNLVSNVIDKIEADTFVDENVFFNQQNDYPYLIPVKNGLLNVRERRISDFDPKRYFFNKINAEFNPSQDCPKIKDFFRDVVPGKEDVEGLREFIGYCLVKKYNYAKSLMLEGDGSNGKTTMIKLITHFLGEENISNVTLHSLDNDRFSMAVLHNKLANLVPDIGSQDLTSTAHFRALTGNDPVQADRKFRSSISFVNYAKMIFGANNIPMPKDDVDAFFRRWIIISFPYKFIPERDFAAYKHRGNVKLRDDDMLQKILGEDEISGFLNWVLDGYKNVEEKGDFTNTRSALEVKSIWTRMSNSFAAFFMDEMLDTDDDVVVLKSDVHRAYNSYCKDNGVKPLSQKKVNWFMTNEKGAFDTRIRFLDGERPSCWVGFKFKKGVVVNRDGHKLAVLNYENDDGGVQEIVNSVVEEDVVDDVADVSVSLLDRIRKVLNDGEVAVEKLFKDVVGFGEVELDKLVTRGVLFEVRPGVVRFVD
jgi:P4 family phage/plasmid primase-like protien